MTTSLVEAVTEALNATGKLAAFDQVPRTPPPIYAAVLDGVTQATARRMGPKAHWNQAAVRVMVVARTVQGARHGRDVARAALQGAVVVEGSTPLVEGTGGPIAPDGPAGDRVHIAPLNYSTHMPLT